MPNVTTVSSHDDNPHKIRIDCRNRVTRDYLDLATISWAAGGRGTTTMRRIEVGQLITILANVAVLVGLVALMLELRQNTQALRNEADVAIWSIGSQTAGLVADNREIAELLLATRTQELTEFSPIEQFRISLIFQMLVDRFELQFRLSERNGEMLQRVDWVFPEDILEQQSFKTWWQSNRHIAHPDFRTYLDSFVE